MLSKNTAYILEVAVANEKIADEIAARLIASAPVDAIAAQAVLGVLDKNLNKQIEDYLTIALSSRVTGKAIAKKVNGLVSVLEAQTQVSIGAGVAASFTGTIPGGGFEGPTTITADNEGTIGNSVSLSFDGSTSIDTAISDWNIANPANTITQTVANGNGTPTNGTVITLSGGSDGVIVGGADVVAAQSEMGSEAMSDEIFERLVVALASRSAAQEIRSAYDAMVSAAQSI